MSIFSHHPAADSDDAKQNIPIGEMQSTMPYDDVKG